MNVGNLLKVKAMILDEPKRFNMEFFVAVGTRKLAAQGLSPPSCGTVGCIAGWGAIVARLENPRLEKLHGIKTIETVAAAIAYYTDALAEACEFFEIDWESGGSLFFERHWPVDLWSMLSNEEPGTTGYAQAAAAAIDRFIACNGNWDDDKGSVFMSKAAR